MPKWALVPNQAGLWGSVSQEQKLVNLAPENWFPEGSKKCQKKYQIPEAARALRELRAIVLQVPKD